VRIGAEEEIDDTKGMKPEEIEEMIKEKDAKAKAQILEMVMFFSYTLLTWA
jgi:peptidyl-prolyl cis-trans isomerase-like 4